MRSGKLQVVQTPGQRHHSRTPIKGTPSPLRLRSHSCSLSFICIKNNIFILELVRRELRPGLSEVSFCFGLSIPPPSPCGTGTSRQIQFSECKTTESGELITIPNEDHRPRLKRRNELRTNTWVTRKQTINFFYSICIYFDTKL